MQHHASIRVLPLIVAIAAPGCSGTNPLGAPVGGLNPSQHSTRASAHSWINPGGGAGKLLYVTEDGTGSVNVYTYPGLSYVGELTGFEYPLFDCPDKHGNIWISDYGTGKLYEYAHGGTSAISELSPGYLTYACAVNLKDGDLAVAILRQTSSQFEGGVAVYHHAQGSPNIYFDSNFTLTYGVAYDGSGNLWVDGFAAGDAFHYAELPAGSSSFTDVALSTSPSSPGTVAWDGQYVDIGDDSETIYQTQGPSVVNTIRLYLAGTMRGFLITGSQKKRRVIAADINANMVDVFPYPAGGSILKSINGGSEPWGVALSN